MKSCDPESAAKRLFSPFICAAVCLWFSAVRADPVYMPPSANLTYGDVTHGQPLHASSSNPAGPIVDLRRTKGDLRFGTLVSFGAGLEYGNVQDLFDTIDYLAEAFKPSEPGPGEMPPPGQNPDKKPDGGVDIGMPIEPIDPDLKAAIDAAAKEVATLGALLGFIAVEGYGKAFLEADAPVVIGAGLLGGAWSFGLNWSGTSKAFGLVKPIEFDAEQALNSLESAYDLQPGDPATVFDLSGDVLMRVDPNTGSVRIAFDNDSSLVTKASQTTAFNLGYSREVRSTAAGSLFLGVEGKYYSMKLSRLSVRFGDITDSDELFDAIRHSDFDDDNEFGFDVGALWVSDNYQVGAEVTNINEPDFTFPAVNLEPYKDPGIISLLSADRIYTMERQLKLETSLFTTNRKWSAHLGFDANAVPDPMGDDFQWLTLGAGFASDNWWLPGARIGYRKNLAGTEIGYLGIGVTALKFVNIDIASAVDTVRISGTKLPRGLMISLGFQIAF